MNPVTQKEVKHYRFLKRNLLLSVIVGAITPMILVSSIILYQFNKSYHVKINAHIEELVHKHKQNIDSFLKEKLGDIRTLSNSFIFHFY